MCIGLCAMALISSKVGSASFQPLAFCLSIISHFECIKMSLGFMAILKPHFECETYIFVHVIYFCLSWRVNEYTSWQLYKLTSGKLTKMSLQVAKFTPHQPSFHPFTLSPLKAPFPPYLTNTSTKINFHSNKSLCYLLHIALSFE